MLTKWDPIFVFNHWSVNYTPYECCLGYIGKTKRNLKLMSKKI